MSTRKAPRWTIPFLRALERTGEVEAAARDAGVDKSTAYARRRAHSDFAADWDSALARREGVQEEEVQERVGFWERVKAGLSVAPRDSGQSLDFARDERKNPTASRPCDGEARKEHLLASTSLGGKIVRAGPGRWNQAAEQRFFDELAATANVSRAAEAAGVSKNAVYQRRMKRADFRAKWDAVLETGRAAIEMHLVETAKKSFDPEDLDVGDLQPKVSVAEAIRIVQLHGSKAQREAQEGMLAEQAESMSEDEVEQIRERLVRKLEKLRERFIEEDLQAGWSYDEEHDHMVPPGWVRDPDYRPAELESGASQEAGFPLPRE